MGVPWGPQHASLFLWSIIARHPNPPHPPPTPPPSPTHPLDTQWTPIGHRFLLSLPWGSSLGCLFYAHTAMTLTISKWRSVRSLHKRGNDGLSETGCPLWFPLVIPSRRLAAHWIASGCPPPPFNTLIRSPAAASNQFKYCHLDDTHLIKASFNRLKKKPFQPFKLYLRFPLLSSQTRKFEKDKS